MYAVVMFLSILYGRVMASFTSAQDFFVSNGQSKKFGLIKKSHVRRMSAEPFVSRAKPLPAKRSEKRYGDESENA